MTATIVPVILSGGSGTRLWPLSRRAKPKQFLPLLGDRTLFQQTLLRLTDLPNVSAPIVVCNQDHGRLVEAQLREIGIEAGAIVLEPIGRNTAPAVAIAAQLAIRHPGAEHAAPWSGGAGDEARSAVSGTAAPLLLVLPADHVIRDEAAFREAVLHAVAAATSGRLVTFGIVPDKPETGYGYIRRGPSHGDWHELNQFIEKPDRDTAAGYVASGDFLWNSGMFVFDAAQFLQELERHRPDIATSCVAALAENCDAGGFHALGEKFAACPSDSIDYAVMEKTRDAAVVPLDAGWSDVGSWTALHEANRSDSNGNCASAEVVLQACSNTYAASTSRKVIAIGLDGIIVIETKDAVLVMAADRAQEIKDVVEVLEQSLR